MCTACRQAASHLSVHNLQEVVRRVVRREVQPVQCTTFKEWSILAQQLRAQVQPLFLELEEEKCFSTPIFNDIFNVDFLFRFFLNVVFTQWHS